MFKARAKLFILTTLAVGVRLTCFSAEIVPSDPQTPLLRVYEFDPLPDTGWAPHTHQAKAKTLLLSISTLGDLQALPDEGARAVLNSQDSRIFSELTHSHNFLVLFTGDEKAGVTMHFAAPIEDGFIEFTRANYSTGVASYLLHRYHKTFDATVYPVWGSPGVIYGKEQLMEHGVWATGDVFYDKTKGLSFRVDKPVEGNTTGRLVDLAVPEALANSFGPMCYRAAEKHTKLRLCGAFLPRAGERDAARPSVIFVIWKLHLPTDPDELPPNEKVILGPNDKVPGYQVIPKKPE